MLQVAMLFGGLAGLFMVLESTVVGSNSGSGGSDDAPEVETETETDTELERALDASPDAGTETEETTEADEGQTIRWSGLSVLKEEDAAADATRVLEGDDSSTDSFELTVTEATSSEGNAAPIRDESGVEVVYGPVVTEFEPGADNLIVSVELADGDTYDVSGAELQEDAGSGTTDLVIQLTARDEETADREIVVEIGATGISLDDITFAGAAQPVVA